MSKILESKILDKPIGVIKAEGAGPEIMESALACLKEIEKIKKIKFNFIEYEGPAPIYGNLEKAYPLLKNFYKKIKTMNGCILRAGIFAAIVYKLRQDFNAVYKPIYLKAIPELFDTALLKKKIAEKIDILLIRNNCEGLLFTKEKIRKTKKVNGCFMVLLSIEKA